MRRGLGQEDIMQKQFGTLIKRYEGLRKLNCSWWSYDSSGEYRTLKTGALLKAKGLRPGKSDYEFKYTKDNISHHVYIEFKTEKGKQSDNQKAFEKTCDADNEHYYIVRSIVEAMNVLSTHNILDNT
jgi:hypothetical protein